MLNAAVGVACACVQREPLLFIVKLLTSDLHHVGQPERKVCGMRTDLLRTTESAAISRPADYVGL